MNNIIKKITAICNQFATLGKTSWHELSYEEQLSLILDKNYQKCKRALKKQKFDDKILLLMITGCQTRADDCYYKLLCYSYKRYGFSDAVKLAVLCPDGKMMLPIVDEIIKEYGFGPHLEERELKYQTSIPDVIELLGYGNDVISDFFMTTRGWYAILMECKHAKLVRESYYSFAFYRPTSGGLESFYDMMLGNFDVPTTEELKESFVKAFASHETQDAVLTSGNEEWIDTMSFLLELSVEASLEVFGEFDESLLSEQAKKMINY